MEVKLEVSGKIFTHFNLKRSTFRFQILAQGTDFSSSFSLKSITKFSSPLSDKKSDSPKRLELHRKTTFFEASPAPLLSSALSP